MTNHQDYRDIVNIRWHRGYGHGLRPGTTQDINCLSCKREQEAGQAPRITAGQHPDITQEA